jgi:hypothetical protein
VIKAQKITKWPGAVIVFTLLLAAFALTGCGSEEPVPVVEGAAGVEIAAVEVQATETAAAVVDETAVKEALVEETATSTSLSAGVTEEPTDECLACHIDKEMLIATADPEEEVISENEGEG